MALKKGNHALINDLGFVDLKWFTVNADGVNDDLPILKEAITYAVSKNINKVFISKGVFLFDVKKETDTITLPDNFTLEFSKDSLIKFGISKAPYYPLFWIKGKNQMIDGLNLEWTGDLDFTTETGTVTRYGITTIARAFSTLIGLDNPKNTTITNTNVFGTTDNNVYDAFIRSFSNTTDLTIDNCTLSHYNNAISDGVRNATITNIKGTKRSNKVNNTSGKCWYGPSHLFYASLSNSYIENIKEDGVSLDDGTQGGATIQCVSTANTVIKDVYTNMKNTPSISFKDDGTLFFESVTVDGIVCVTTKWDTDRSDGDANLQIPVYFVTNTKIKSMFLSNVIVDAGLKNIMALRFSGTNIVGKNIKVNASKTSVSRYPLIAITSCNNSDLDLITDTSGTKPNVLYVSGANYNNISLKKLGVGGEVYFGNIYDTTTWGLNQFNKFIFVNESILSDIVGIVPQEAGVNTFVNKDGIILKKYTFTQSGSITQSIRVEKNKSYNLSVSSLSGDSEHGIHETFIIVGDKRNVNSFNAISPTLYKATKGQGADMIQTVTLTSDNFSTILNITTTTIRNNVSLMYVSLNPIISF